jgi:hypothetical protein
MWDVPGVSLYLTSFLFSVCIIVSGTFSPLESGREQRLLVSLVSPERPTFSLFGSILSIQPTMLEVNDFSISCFYSSLTLAFKLHYSTDRFINLEINQSMLYSYIQHRLLDIHSLR